MISTRSDRASEFLTCLLAADPQIYKQLPYSRDTVTPLLATRIVTGPHIVKHLPNQRRADKFSDSQPLLLDIISTEQIAKKKIHTRLTMI